MVRLTAGATDGVAGRVGVGPPRRGVLRVAGSVGAALLVACRATSAALQPLVLCSVPSDVTEKVFSEGYTRGGQERRAGRGAAGGVRCVGRQHRPPSRLPLGSTAAPGDLLAIITL